MSPEDGTMDETVAAAGRADILAGDTALGIELGSTRIKATLIGPDHRPLASGSHDWSNRLVDGLWTYDLDDVTDGLQACYADLVADVDTRYGVDLTSVGALGCSAMMHGYLAFDAAGALLVPFRTWRNTNTEQASRALTDLFDHPVPHRWSIAHLYQAILDGEEHVHRVARLTTLAGYVHERLTGRHVLGVGDASGMFPIDPRTGGFDADLTERFDELVARHGLPWRLTDILPVVLPAGADGGTLTERGAQWLDVTGTLQHPLPLCPPEGDAGTGMVATNSVAPGTGNVSAGTSIFAMVVLEQPLGGVHPEIDIVTTPTGDLVAMVHCNNGTGELDAWVAVFAEFAVALGVEVDRSHLFRLLYGAAMTSAPDADGLVAYNYLSGEPITMTEHGRPLLVRGGGDPLTLATLFRAQLNATLAVLRLGMDVLDGEGVHPRQLLAHGGLFKTEGVGQRLLAAALDTTVLVGETAGEGGPWGMALLAAYRRDRLSHRDTRTLPAYLDESVFRTVPFTAVTADRAEVDGFTSFVERYRRGLPVEHQAGSAL